MRGLSQFAVLKLKEKRREILLVISKENDASLGLLFWQMALVKRVIANPFKVLKEMLALENATQILDRVGEFSQYFTISL